MVDIGQNIEKTLKHPGGRPITVFWRFDENHNIINKNPTKRDYNINYYKNIKTTCDLCNRQVVWKHMKRHQMSDICKKINSETSLERAELVRISARS